MPPKTKKTEPKRITAGSIDPKKRVSSAPDGLHDPADPGHRWERPLQAPGRMQVDFEERVDFRRLHEYRLARTKAQPRRSAASPNQIQKSACWRASAVANSPRPSTGLTVDSARCSCSATTATALHARSAR